MAAPVNKPPIGGPIKLQARVRCSKTGKMVLKNPDVLSEVSGSSSPARNSPQQELKTSKSKVPFTPSSQLLLSRELKSPSLAKDKTAQDGAHVPQAFPTSDPTPPVPPPKDAPRVRHQSKTPISPATRAVKSNWSAGPSEGLTTASQQSRASPSTQRLDSSPVQSIPGPSTAFGYPQTKPIDVMIDCLKPYEPFEALMKACEGHKVGELRELNVALVKCLDHCMQEVDLQLPSHVTLSSAYMSARADYQFNRIACVSSSDRDFPSDMEAVLHSRNSANLIWASFTRILEALKEEDQNEACLHVVQEPSPSPDSAIAEEVKEVVTLLKSSSGSSFANKRRKVTEGFRKLSLSFKRNKGRRGAIDTDTLSTSQSPTPTPSSSSSTLVASVQSKGLPEDSSSAPCKEDRFGLRQSHIFFTAASACVADPPVPMKNTPTFRWEWYISIPEEEGLWVTVGSSSVLAAGSLRFLARHVLANLDNSKMASVVDAFLTFFRQHATPLELFNTLATWFEHPSAGGQIYCRNDATAFRRFTKTQLIRLLTRWLENYWLKEEDKDVKSTLLRFTHDVVASDPDIDPKVAGILAATVCRTADAHATKYTRRFQTLITKAETEQQAYPPTPFQIYIAAVDRGMKESTVDILSFSPSGGAEEVARALTILESQKFHELDPTQLACDSMHGDFSTLTQWNDLGNSLSMAVINSILNHNDVHRREEVFELWVDIACACKSMRNFNSALQIVTALNVPAIADMPTLKIRVEAQKCMEFLTQLHKFFRAGKDSENSYSAEIRQTRPAIPIVHKIKAALNHFSQHPKRLEQASKAKEKNYMDIMYYEPVLRTVRMLENIYGKYSIPRQDVVVKWVQDQLQPFANKNWDHENKKFLERSYKIDPRPAKKST